jgi:predicted transcriptional regulator
LEEKEIHLVKKVSQELGLTYKELAEEIGYTEGNLRKSVSENRLSCNFSLSTQKNSNLQLF